VEDKVQSLLALYGLDEKEATVYIHLLRRGPQGAGQIAKATHFARMDAYRVLKRLEEAGLVHPSPGRPVVYQPEPIEDAVPKLMREEKGKVMAMEQARNELLSISRGLAREQAKPLEQKFRIVQGRQRVYEAVGKMAVDCKAKLDLLLTANDLAQLYLLGVLGEVEERARGGLAVRVLAPIEPGTLEAAEYISKTSAVRHIRSGTVGRLIVADGDSTLVSLVLDDSSGAKNPGDVAIWTNSSAYTTLMAQLFTLSFDSAEPGDSRIKQLHIEARTEKKLGAVLDLLRGAIPESGSLEVGAVLRGASGLEHRFDAVVKEGQAPLMAVEIALGSKTDVKEKVMSSLMKAADVQGCRVLVLASPYLEDLEGLAKMLNVAYEDSGDPVKSVARVSALLKGP